MPSSKLRLEFFRGNHSDTSIDAFTHWVQSKYDEINVYARCKPDCDTNAESVFDIGDCSCGFQNINKGE